MQTSGKESLSRAHEARSHATSKRKTNLGAEKVNSWQPQLATARPWALCGFGRSTWFRLLGSGRAPLGIRVAPKKRIWAVSEIGRWLDSAGADAGELQGEGRR